MSAPTVSVIIAVYNRASLVSRALHSLIAQTYRDWECVIVDDGSTDDSVQISQQFVDLDARLTLLKRPHLGGFESVNAGFRAARGTYISILDSDDEYHPTHLELRVKEMAAHPEIDLLHGGVTVFGDEFVPDKYDVTKKISLYDPNIYIGGTIFGKKTVFKSLEGFKDLPYAADSDFIERAINQFRVKRVSWPTYLYHREHNDSWTKNLV